MANAMNDFPSMETMFDETTAVATGSTEVAHETTVPAVAKASAVAVADDFEIDMPAGLEDALGSSGVVVADIGTKISKVPLEKFKASTTKNDRIGFMTRKIMAVKSHYIEGNGSVLCFGGKCCELCGAPTVRYLFPIAVYSTDNDGNIIGRKVELKILSAGEDLYKSIITINKGSEGQGGIDHIDLLVTCTDDKYQKITLTPCGSAVWRKYPAITTYLREKWAKDGSHAYQAIARKVDEDSFLKLMGMDAIADSEESAAPSISSNTDLAQFFDEA